MMHAGKAAAFLTLALVITVPGELARAHQGDKHDSARRIEGTWLVQLTLVQCDTGVEVPNSTAPGLHTFNAGGTMISTPPANPATLSIGHGVWTQVGRRNYQNTIRLMGFSPAGAVIGIATVRRNIVLSRDGRSLTSYDTSEFRDLAGNLIGQRCASVTGTRLD